MEMTEEKALSVYAFMQLKEVVEAKYGPDNLRICAAIINEVTMRPSADVALINYCKNNREMIEDAYVYIKRFPDIIDALSALIDFINEERLKAGEENIAKACLSRARELGVYAEDSLGKAEILKQCDGSLNGIQLDNKTSSGGCLGLVLAFVGFSSVLSVGMLMVVL